MNEIVFQILRSYGDEVGAELPQKLDQYLALMSSTGKTEAQLLHLGHAYLKEVLAPDSRYTGC